MSNKNILGITEGEWISDDKNGYKCIQDNKGNLIAYMSAKPGRPHKANMDFIADAGTTANKCGKLFSEILKERDMLKSYISELLGSSESLSLSYETLIIGNKLIQSIEKE